MNGNNLEKETITFSKPLLKKDIKTLLAHLSEEVSYEMINLGNLKRGIDIPIQNECSGTIEFGEKKVSYVIHLTVDKVYHMQLVYPITTAREVCEIVKKRITDFFLRYPSGTP